MIIKEIINSFLELNKIKSHNPGESSRLLASRTKYYKNIINNYDKSNKDEYFYKELVKLHAQLVKVEVTQVDKNHMIHDSINFVERLINKKMKEYYQQKTQ